MTNAGRDQRRALLELAAGRVSAARDPLRDLGTTRSLAIEGALSRIEQRLEREAARLGCATKYVKAPKGEGLVFDPGDTAYTPSSRGTRA